MMVCGGMCVEGGVKSEGVWKDVCGGWCEE